jgi:hypothetical protein
MQTHGHAAYRAFILALATVATLRAATVTVSSYQDGEEVRYPVVLLRGTTDPAATAVTATNGSSTRPDREIAGQAQNGRFAVLVRLVPGENVLTVSCGDARAELRLRYRAQTNPAMVRVIYVTDSSGNTGFDRPEGSSEDWLGRLRTAVLLMQTFTAEQCHLAGLPRRTFNLEFDDAGDVVVRILKATGPASEYQAMDGNQLYSALGRERDTQLPPGDAADLVIPAFTRFDRATGQAKAHTALGGGNLALFGSGDLFTWPESLARAQPAFMDEQKVDPALFFSDSVGRHTYWACASTTMGAALHELGHVFGLPHSSQPHDIMTRGHDRFNRYFTLSEPPHAGRATAYAFRDDEVATWAPVSLRPLFHERLLALDTPAAVSSAAPRVALDPERQEVVVESAAGIGAVVLQTYGTAEGIAAREPLALPPFPGLPARATIPAARIGRVTGTLGTSLAIRDGTGRRHHVRLADLLRGPFVEQWHLAPETVPWPDTSRFPTTTPEQLDGSAKSALATAPRLAAGPFVDLIPWMGDGKTERRAAYLCRRLTVLQDTPVRIGTGSDDALRLWLDGSLVREVLALRGSTPDSEWTDLVLQPGAHALLVEVSQGLGDWGFHLRLTTPDGQPLRLADDGAIVPVDSSRLARFRQAVEEQYVRRWYLWPDVLPWTDRRAFVPLPPDLRQRIEAECSATAPAVAGGPGPVVDLTALHPQGKRTDAASYALRRIVVAAPRRVRLYTGSDDALRMWLNGNEIRSVLALRSTVPDAEQTEVELVAGENRLLMEVSQASGGWGFCLRLEDADGTSLLLTSEGEIVRLEP